MAKKTKDRSVLEKTDLNEALWADGALIWGSLSLSFFSNVLKLATPILMLSIYDSVLVSGSIETLTALTFLAILAIFTWALSDFSRRRIAARFGARFQERLESKAFDINWDRSMKNRNSQADSYINTAELNKIRSFFHSAAIITVFDFIWSPIFLVVLYFINPIAVGISVICILLISLIYYAGNFLNSKKIKSAKKSSNLASTKTTNFERQIGTVLNLNMIDTVKNSWMSYREDSRDAAVSRADGNGLIESLISFVQMSSHAVILAFSAYQVINVKLTVGGMVASIIISQRFIIPVKNFIRQLPNTTGLLVNWKSLNEKFKDSPNFTPAYITTEPLPVVLGLNGVQVESMNGKERVLDKINFEIGPGEVVQIIGSAGSGKTVLQKTISGAIIPRKGTVEIQGVNISQLSATQISSFIGVVDENASLITGTVAENIVQFSSPIDKKKVMEAASMANSLEIIQRLPKGFNTKISSADNFLSRSERTAICLTRSIYYRPKIILIDRHDEFILDGLMRPANNMVSKLREEKISLIMFSRKKISIPVDQTLILESGNLIKENLNVSRIANF